MTMVLKSPFCDWLAQHNNLGALGFKRWLFQPGMRFNDIKKWWGDFGLRHAAHEGVDFCCFENREGEIVILDGEIVVPTMYDGEVAAVFDDFMGQSILMQHTIYHKAARLYSIYAHTLPLDTVRAGASLRAGENIATLYRHKNGPIAPHLHLSVLWVQMDCQAEKIRWETINDPDIATLCNPLDFLQFSPEVLDSEQMASGNAPWHVYIVRCIDDTLYTGIARDIRKRLEEHNHGKNGAKYTRSRRPVRLVYCEPAESRSAAARREYQLKNLPLPKKKALINSSGNE